MKVKFTDVLAIHHRDIIGKACRRFLYKEDGCDGRWPPLCVMDGFYLEYPSYQSVRDGQAWAHLQRYD